MEESGSGCVNNVWVGRVGVVVLTMYGWGRVGVVVLCMCEGGGSGCVMYGWGRVGVVVLTMFP